MKLGESGLRSARPEPSAVGDAVRFFSFHLMPYPALPSDYDGPAWEAADGSKVVAAERQHAIERRLRQAIQALDAP